MSREAGRIEFGLKGSDKADRFATVQCVHCGMHYVAKPPKGSLTLTDAEIEYLQIQGKTVRGFCHRCNGPVCGKKCAECNGGIERGLEIVEGSADPAAVSVYIAGSWID